MTSNLLFLLARLGGLGPPTCGLEALFCVHSLSFCVTPIHRETQYIQKLTPICEQERRTVKHRGIHYNFLTKF